MNNIKLPNTRFTKWSLINLLLAVATFFVCVLTAAVSMAPQTYVITSGGIADQTITAPRDVVDEVTTKRMIEEVQAKVGPVYKKDSTVSQQILKSLDEHFSALNNVREYGMNAYNNAISQRQQLGVAGETAAVFVPAQVDWNALLTQDDWKKIKEIAPEYFTQQELDTAMSLTQEELLELQNEIKKRIQTDLYTGISETELEAQKTKIANFVTDELSLTAPVADLVWGIVKNDLIPNMIFDEAATQAERDAAAEGVIPAMYKTGQNIVVKGEIISAEQFEVLKDLGLVAADISATKPYFAFTLYILMLFVMYSVFLVVFNRPLLKNTKKIGILSILTAMAYITTAIGQLISPSLFPIILFVILGAVLLSPKNALVYSVFLSLLCMSVTTSRHELLSLESLLVLLITLIGSFFAVVTLKNMQYRSTLFVAGLASMVPGVILQLICWMLKLANVQQMLYASAIMMASGAMCGMISIGVLPLMESLFNLTTPTKLLELSDPTHPLTKRLMIEAPGTYHHSILVANLAEAACNAVGGYSLMARVGAYFHDVGKIENPLYFKENQRNNVNPHDLLAPEESASIIRKHIPDGVNLLNKHKMPKEIVEILKNHHGNGTVGYFYAKAYQENPDVDIKLFSYEGSPPVTKEGALVMLADVVEAAVRSLDNPTREDISKMVYKLIKSRYDEGLLDKAPLNRHDLNEVAEAFINIFDGVYHSRIKYPQIKPHGAEHEDRIL